MDQKDLCEHTRIRLIAAAIGHQKCTKTESNLIELPGTNQLIAIGTAARVRELVDAAPIPPLTAPAPLTDLTVEELMGALKMANERLAELTAAPAPQLTDERIDELCKPWVGLGGIENQYEFARAIEREVAKAAPDAPVQTNDVRPTDSPNLSIGSVAFFSALIEYGKTPTLAKRLEVADIIDKHIDRIVELYSVAAPVQAEQAQAEPVATIEFNAERMGHLINRLSVANRREGWKGAPEYNNADRARAAQEVDAAERNLLNYVKSLAAPALPAQAEQVAAVRAAALEEAAKLIDTKVYNYQDECGSYDHTTGVTEYPGNGAEWICEMEELAEEIRALAAPSTTPSNDTSAQGDTGGDHA